MGLGVHRRGQRELVDAVRDMGSGGSFTDVWRSVQGAADRVSEADILDLYRDRPAQVSVRAVEDYRQARETADRQRVLDYAMMDAAAALALTLEGAQESFDDLTANSNVSNTALQQAQVAAALTQGRINAAVAQVLAYRGRRAGEPGAAGRDRPARAARRVAGRAAADERDVRRKLRAGALDNREQARAGLLFQVPSFYMGGQS